MNQVFWAFVLGIVLAVPAINFLGSVMALLEGTGFLVVAAFGVFLSPEICRVVRHAATEESVAD